MQTLSFTLTVGKERRAGAWLAALLVGLFLSTSAAVEVRADNPPVVKIKTKNGDRLSGKLVGVAADKLELETPYAGKVVVRAAEIKSWRASDAQQRQQIAAAFAPPVAVVAKAAPPKPPKPLKLEARPKPAAAKGEPWQRALNLAYTQAHGNVNLSDVNISFGLAHKQGTGRVAFTALGRYGVQNGAQVAHLVSSTLRNEFAPGKLPAFAETAFEIDRIKKLDYRISESLGLTYAALKKESSTLNLDFGTGVNYEIYSTGLRRATAISLLRATAAQKLNGKVQLNQQISLFSDLAAPDNLRMQTDVSLTMPINKHLGFRIAALNRYDHRPPSAAIKRNDFSLLTGFSINF